MKNSIVRKLILLVPLLIYVAPIWSEVAQVKEYKCEVDDDYQSRNKDGRVIGAGLSGTHICVGEKQLRKYYDRHGKKRKSYFQAIRTADGKRVWIASSGIEILGPVEAAADPASTTSPDLQEPKRPDKNLPTVDTAASADLQEPKRPDKDLPATDVATEEQPVVAGGKTDKGTGDTVITPASTDAETADHQTDATVCTTGDCKPKTEEEKARDAAAKIKEAAEQQQAAAKKKEEEEAAKVQRGPKPLFEEFQTVLAKFHKKYGKRKGQAWAKAHKAAFIATIFKEMGPARGAKAIVALTAYGEALNSCGGTVIRDCTKAKYKWQNMTEMALVVQVIKNRAASNFMAESDLVSGNGPLAKQAKAALHKKQFSAWNTNLNPLGEMMRITNPTVASRAFETVELMEQGKIVPLKNLANQKTRHYENQSDAGWTIGRATIKSPQILIAGVGTFKVQAHKVYWGIW